jgi:IS30 family transposase
MRSHLRAFQWVPRVVLFLDQVPISASLPMFEHTAREIADDLGRDPSPVAQEIARRAREMVELFSSWGAQAPSDEDRAHAIQKVLDLHREAHEYQARRR